MGKKTGKNPTDRGKLGVRFHYRVERGQLEASTEVLVSNIHVAPSRQDDEVKKRIGLPLGLIVALITDANNDLKVTLPMSGPLERFKTDFGDAIWTVVKNVVVNIAAAPFRGIGRLFTGGDQKVEALTNPKVLDAMRWAVDYQGMADSILKGQWAVHQAFLPIGFLGALEETPYSLDIEKAKALLAESGVELPLKVSLTVRNNQERMDIAQSIQNTFAQAGIELTLDVGDGAQVLDKYRARQHEITLQTWGPDYPDPHTNASTFAMNPDNSDEAKATGYLAWRTAWDPGEMGAETAAAVAEMDGEKRAEMYRSIQAKHRDDSAFVLMFGQLQQTGLRANVSGFYTGGAVDSASYWLVTK